MHSFFWHKLGKNLALGEEVTAQSVWLLPFILFYGCTNFGFFFKLKNKWLGHLIQRVLYFKYFILKYLDVLTIHFYFYFLANVLRSAESQSLASCGFLMLFILSDLQCLLPFSMKTSCITEAWLKPLKMLNQRYGNKN